MCFITKRVNKRVAKKDIIVYKEFKEITKEHALSYVRQFEYNFNKLYSTKLDTPKHVNISKFNNYCFYKISDYKYSDNIQKHLISCISTKNTNLYIISVGYHSINLDRLYKSISNYNILNNLSKEFNLNNMLKCIIPKGATYYTDTFGYYVSNQIIITHEHYEI